VEFNTIQFSFKIYKLYNCVIVNKYTIYFIICSFKKNSKIYNLLKAEFQYKHIANTEICGLQVKFHYPSNHFLYIYQIDEINEN